MGTNHKLAENKMCRRVKDLSDEVTLYQCDGIVAYADREAFSTVSSTTTKTASGDRRIDIGTSHNTVDAVVVEFADGSEQEINFSNLPMHWLRGGKLSLMYGEGPVGISLVSVQNAKTGQIYEFYNVSGNIFRTFWDIRKTWPKVLLYLVVSFVILRLAMPVIIGDALLAGLASVFLWLIGALFILILQWETQETRNLRSALSSTEFLAYEDKEPAL